MGSELDEKDLIDSVENGEWQSAPDLDEERERDQLRRSLQNPHPESAEFAELGPEEWTRGLPDENAEALVDRNAGTPVRWVCGEGWVEGRE